MEIDRASIHFVNLSMVTSRWVKPPRRLFEWRNQVELPDREGHVSDGSTGSCPKAPEYRGELGNPPCIDLVQPVEDPGLEAL